MKKLSLSVALALAWVFLVLIWGTWQGAQAAPSEAPRAQAAFGDVVINEVAWMGTVYNPADEWIELYNPTDHPLTLDNWRLMDDDNLDITLSGVIPADGYYLLERSDDTAIADVAADWTGSFGSGGLSNDGQALTLTNESGFVIDTANTGGGGWPAGDNDTKSSMERVDPTAPDSDDNWATNNGLTRNGHDAADNPINGTPKAQNSAYLAGPSTGNVRLYALHPYALYSGDEAVALINLDTVTATLAGWGLSDGDPTPDVAFPAVEVPPGGIVWIAKNADNFRYAFGFDADAALGNDWPGFANTGDEALFFDGDGHLLDTLVYGTGVTTTTGWSGAAVPYPRGGFGDGQILYRKLDQATGTPVPDTGTAADWAQDGDDPINGEKVRFPGWDLEAFFFPTQVTQTASLDIWVAPDGLYEGVSGALAAAQSSLRIEGYTFESAELTGVITDLLGSGVTVTMLLEGSPAFGLSDQQLWACGQMADAGAEIYFMHNDDEPEIHDRYDYQHAKFAIVDGTTVLIGSENFSPGGMPADDKSDGTWGHRGVFLATDAPGVVARAQAIFDHDLDPAHSDIVAWGTHDFTAPPDFTPIYTPAWVTYTARFSGSLSLHGTFAFEVIQSPETSLRDLDALLGLLARAGAGDTILVQQLYEHPDWDGDPNPRVEALLAAARRGATVQLLLDSRYDDPTKSNSNRATADALNAIALGEGLDLEVRTGNPTGEGVHNKMVLAQVDGRGWVHVGSINGSEASNKVNRELALQVQSDEAYAFLKAVFEHDWQASWQSSPGVTSLYLPVVARNYVPPANHIVISELLYDPAGVADADGEWIELYNPTFVTVTLAGWRLGDGSSYGDGAARFPAGAQVGPGETVIVAQRVDAFESIYGFAPDFELRGTDPSVPDMTPTDGGISWGNAGDEAILRDATGADVDVLVYGSGSYAGVTPHPAIGWGHSLERKPADRDTDDCSADFWERYTPAPGQVTLD